MENGKLSIQDYIIYGIIFIIPYLEGGPWNWMYKIPFVGTAGPSSLSLILAIYIAWYSFRHNLHVRFKFLNALVWIATIYSIYKLTQTIRLTGISEALTVYRKNYVYLPDFALIMTYLSNMCFERIKSLGHLIFISCIPITLIYFAQCFGIDIFTDTMLIESAGGIIVTRNILGFPPVVPIIISLSFALMIFTYDKKYIWFTALLMAACFISYTRNFVITTAFAFILIVIMYSIKYGIKNNIKLIIYSLLLFVAVIIIAPDSISFWDNLLDSTFNVQLEKGVGTYAIRQKLIDHALERVTNSNALFTGIGYIRDVAKGSYSLVLGSDTFVAPILWCEGIIGLVLRCLPIAYLLWKVICIYRNYKDQVCVLFSVVIIASIISQIPNYVQTTIFVNYCFMFAQLFLIYVFLNYYIELKKYSYA